MILKWCQDATVLIPSCNVKPTVRTGTTCSTKIVGMQLSVTANVKQLGIRRNLFTRSAAAAENGLLKGPVDGINTTFYQLQIATRGKSAISRYWLIYRAEKDNLRRRRHESLGFP